jgi:hypothetical protein
MNIGLMKIILKMNKLFLLVFVLVSGLSLSQTKQTILFSREKGNTEQTLFLKKNKMDSIIILYQDDFVKNNALVFDKEMLKTSINARIPDPKAKGMAVLDWEGDIARILLGEDIVDEATFNKTVDNYVASIELAKKLRPNMKWGFYNYPPIIYADTDLEFTIKTNYKYEKILQAVDFLTPSLYLLNDRKEVTDDFSYKYAKSNTIAAIKIGLRLKKPVYPFVWHRYSPHSPNSANKLIEEKHLEEFLKNILNASYKGKKVEGLIWWECETYLYNYKVIPDEYKKVKSVSDHQGQIYQRYFNPMTKYLNKR